MIRRMSRAVLVMIISVVLVTGCSIGDLGRQQTGRPTTRPSATSTTATNAAVLDRARRLAEGYNYPAALHLLASLHTTAAGKLAAAIRSQQGKAHPWKQMNQIPHLFFHSLIVDPQKAFASKTSGQGYRDYMVTLREFRAMLPQLRARGYVLVLPRQIAAVDRHGVMRYRKIILPPGKKPLVISQDDVNYYTYMTGDGFASNLTIGANGKVTSTYRTPNGRTVHGSYDVLPVLDDFVAAHPDFSYRGAKGILALTGYNGILGYRTSQREYAKRPDFAAQRRAAQRVATAIKNDGWQFASHSWGHVNFTTTPLAELKADTARWKREVGTLIGPTDLLVYPFGADISGVQPYGNSNAKYRYLHGQGFNFFFNVDASHVAWMQNSAGSIRQARINVDGIRMASTLDGQNTVLNHFFNVRSVIDPARHATTNRHPTKHPKHP